MYKYTSKNLLLKPEKYFYTNFEGQKFIDSYYESRTRFLKNLKVENQDLSSWIEQIDIQNNNEVISTGYVLLNYLKTEKDNNFINILFKKFEVSKKIHCSYDSNSFRPIEKNDNILNYILFGIILIKLYQETKFLGYINSLLKISDIIISQDLIHVIKYAPALKIIIEKELELVNQL